jgi:hypothetical protein
MKISVSVENEAGKPFVGATIGAETPDGSVIFRYEKTDAHVEFEEKGNPYIGKQIRLYAECEGFKRAESYCKVETHEINELFRLSRRVEPEPTRIRVHLDPRKLSATPGLPLALRVELTNLAPPEQMVSINLTGVSSQWVDETSHGHIRLAPAIPVAIDFRITVPRSADTRPGDYQLVVHVNSEDGSFEPYQVHAQLTVTSFPEQVVEINPLTRTSWSRAKYTITVRNAGNASAVYVLDVRPDGPDLTCTLEHDRAELAPGQSTNVELTVAASRRWLVKPRQHSFTVRSRRIVETEEELPSEITGQFVQTAPFRALVAPLSTLFTAISRSLLWWAAVPIGALVVAVAVYRLIPATRPPSQRKVEAAINSLALECADIRVASTEHGLIKLNGYIDTADKLDKIKTRVGSMSGVRDVDEHNVTVSPRNGPRFCMVTKVLGPFEGRSRLTGLAIRPLHYHEADKLVVAVSAKQALNYVYVDYYVADEKNVFHLLPNPKQPNNLTPDATLTIGGTNDAIQWKIAPPYGLEMISVISSDKPLSLSPPVRNVTESAKEYLHSLDDVLKAGAASSEIATAYCFIQSSPQERRHLSAVPVAPGAQIDSDLRSS